MALLVQNGLLFFLNFVGFEFGEAPILGPFYAGN